jgi:hypothetical protein
MAVHLGATCGLGMRPPTLDIACTRRFRSPSRQWFGVTLTIPLLMADLMGLIFACSVSIFFTDHEPDYIHRWHAHNRIQSP